MIHPNKEGCGKTGSWRFVYVCVHISIPFQMRFLHMFLQHTVPEVSENGGPVQIQIYQNLSKAE